jgi:hypothetical protein
MNSMKSHKVSLSLLFRKQREHEQHEVNAPHPQTPGHTMALSPTEQAQTPQTDAEKAAAAAMANECNPFLQLPQEIHNAIFLRLIDPAHADKFSCVHHAGMHDLHQNTCTRHIQRSTPNLRALTTIARTCKQLQSEFAVTVSEYRANTLHHFRILDAEDFRAFELFFEQSRSTALKYRLTPQLKITLPAKSPFVSIVLITLSTFPANLLDSMTLELSQPDWSDERDAKTFMLDLSLNRGILQLGFMACTLVTRRHFDGMWSLFYSPMSGLSEEQQHAWAGTDVASSLWNQRGPHYPLGYPMFRKGVQKWDRGLKILD